jgi:4-amino-4-deoxy-L-arabinose transferase-like glycosyltransferase
VSHPLVRRLRSAPTWLVCLFLAVVSLLPRLWQIGYFITPDENLFLDYAAQFLKGLATGDLNLTFGLGYPGVPLVWANSLALLAEFCLSQLGLTPAFPPGLSLEQFLGGLSVQPLPYYVAARTGTAALVTILLVVVYLVGRRLYGGQMSLIAALLLAFDPPMLGYSRLVHMSVPLALLMLLSVMAWLLWLTDRRTRWLILSGVFCGLSVLTITMGMLVPPTLGVIALLVWLAQRPAGAAWWPGLRQWLGRAFVGWLVSMAVAAATFVAVWPAMWVDPVRALGLSFDWLWLNAQAGFGNWGMYWMGRTVLDPGAAFYPVALLLRISPLLLVGAIANLVTLRRSEHKAVEWSLWAYVVLFFVTMTFGPTKSVRYLLVPLSAMAPLAAWGLLRAAGWVGQRLVQGCWWAMNGGRVLAVAFGVVLLASSLPYAPYYLTYYNPLLLGWLWAPRVMHVGWGEGLDVAARYLDARPNSERMRVAAWYDWAFAPYFKGQTASFSTENALRADYSVFYVSQIQRGIPDPNLITYFRRRVPESVITLNGIDYAWIYPALMGDGALPGAATPVAVRMDDAVTLEGYSVRPATEPGQGLIVRLWWRSLRANLPEYFVYMRAIDAQGQVRARADSPPVMGFWPTPRWQTGQLVEDAQVLVRPPETPAGAYRLEVGVYDPRTWAVLEPASGERGEGGGVILGEINLP